LEIQRGKVERPKWSNKYHKLGATTSCSIRATFKTSNCGQKIDEHRQNVILANSWFSSVNTAEAIHEIGHEWIGVIKTSHSLYPKQHLEDMLKT
jgi:hypothetical protein